ncbi:ribosomal protein S9/S16-domain-containing protein [Melampsora americana]|nr:ribosomal protein S9/S16-domain-containing protein [Melampsora americana]
MTQSIKLSSNLMISSLSSTRRSRPNTIHSFNNRSTSSFIPGRRSNEDHHQTQSNNNIIIPKPTSPNWYTTHPALSDSLFKLDSIIKRSREELYRSNVLKRFSAPVTFEGTGIRLRWLKYRMQESLKNSNSIKSTTGVGAESESESESEKIKLFNILWSSSSKWHDLEKMSELLQGNEGRSLRMIEYKITLKKLNEIKSLKRYLSFLNFSHLSSILQQDPQQKLQIERLNQEIDQILLKFLKPNLIQTSIQDKEFGRDRLGRFYGIGKKKETLRALEITDSLGHYNIHILTHGGGKMGQAAAISHALANALMNALQDSAKTDSSAQERYAKKVLSKSQLTLRDPRVVERKKTGKPGAKSSYRWVKR